VTLNTFFEDDVEEFKSALAAIEGRTRPDADPSSDETLDHLTAAIHRSREACKAAELELPPEELKRAQERFRKEIAPWFDQSWFMERAKAKPRGYPGDFETLTGIYEDLPKSKGIGGYLDRYFLKSDLARAVRGRLDGIQQFLIRETANRKERVSILNVASGPGREYAAGLTSARAGISLKCIDTDEQALEYLRTHIDPSLLDSVDLTCFRYNALRMSSAKANLENFGECDIIYSVGLCDYIPDRFLIKILQGWRESVSPRGIIYVAFKDATQYVASEYQWHVDWFFYERTEADCRDLFAKAGYEVDRLEMFRDETGIIMNFIARAPALGRLRLDGPETVSRPSFFSQR
jgi:extracellular factor (EF) 3-hydroxypalmitic acid methyl ester biosynthesis protein